MTEPALRWGVVELSAATPWAEPVDTAADLRGGDTSRRRLRAEGRDPKRLRICVEDAGGPMRQITLKEGREYVRAVASLRPSLRWQNPPALPLIGVG